LAVAQAPRRGRPSGDRPSDLSTLPLLPHPRLVDLAPAEAPSEAVGTNAGGRAEARVVSDRRLPPEGYRISIAPDNAVTIEAADSAGAFYARATLAQMQRVWGDGHLPAGTVEDWPDFPVRGVMLDVSRNKVPELDTLFGIIDRLASWKVNHLELYIEHTYSYNRHRIVWEEADPYGPQDMERLRSFCAERHVELVPNQNTLGHMERWLLHERYAPLGIARGVVRSPFGMDIAASTIDPANPGSLALVRELLGELGSVVPARRFHVGLDEPWQLPAERRDEFAKWLFSLRSLNELTDRELLVWGDFFAAHNDLLDALPEQVTVCEWGYEANHPFSTRAETLAESDVSHWLSPGTSSWMSILGRLPNAIDNCRAAATAAAGSGAGGLLVTDWGDFGHLQHLPVSDPGLAAAAAFSWCEKANRHLGPAQIGRLLDLHCYDEASSESGVGEALATLGEVYLATSLQMPNMASLVAHVYLPQLPVGSGLTSGLEPEHVDRAESLLDRGVEQLKKAKPRNAHGRLAVEELGSSVRLVRLACSDARERLAVGGRLDEVRADRRAKLAKELAEVTAEHRARWLGRNRAGGLEESCGWLEHLRHCYLSGEADDSWAGPLVEQVRAKQTSGTRPS
jgi:hexosaminidase